MTANPRWQEIVDELLPGQNPADCPDLVSRVFHLKKNHLLKGIVKDGVLGRVRAHVYVIEWQKRGLPHMHLLLWLAPESKLRSSDDVAYLLRFQIKRHIHSCMKQSLRQWFMVPVKIENQMLIV